jgi:hypothetical protein
MADGDRYNRIPKLLPDEASPEAIAASNKTYRKYVDNQLGTTLHNKDGSATMHTDALGRTWEVHNVNGQQVLMRADPTDPMKFTYWDPRQGEVSGYLGGEDMHNTMVHLRSTLPQQNPLTNKNWGKDLNEASYGELQAYRAQNEAAGRTVAPNPNDVRMFGQSHDAIELLKDIEAKFKAVNGAQGLNKLQQAISAINSKTDLANFLRPGGTPDPERANMLGLTRDLMRLNQLGVDVNRLTPEGKGGGTTSAGPLFDLISKSPLAGAISGLSGPIIDSLKKVVSGNFDVDALNENVPLLKAQLQRELHSEVLNAASPEGGRMRLSDEVRGWGNDAADDLEKHNLGPSHAVTESDPILPEQAGGASVKSVTSPTTTTSGDQGSTSTGNQAGTTTDTVGQFEPMANAGIQKTKPYNPKQMVSGVEAIKKGVEAVVKTAQAPNASSGITEGYQRGTPGSQEPQAPQGDKGADNTKVAPAPIAKATPEPSAIPGATPSRTPAVAQPNRTPVAAPKPSKAPIGNQGPETIGNASQPGLGPQLLNPTFAPKDYPTLHLKPWGIFSGASADELPSNSEVGAPLGSPDTRIVGGQPVAHLFHQEHVDGLPPGTPFYWADHADPYVKV